MCCAQRGALHQIFGRGVQHARNKWFRKRSKKRSQQDRNSRRKLIQNASKWSNDRFLWKIRPTLGQIISGTKCDKGKPIFFFCRKRWVIKIKLGIKKGPNGIGKCQKWGSIEWKVPTMFKDGSDPLPPPAPCYVNHECPVTEYEVLIGIMILNRYFIYFEIWSSISAIVIEDVHSWYWPWLIHITHPLPYFKIWSWIGVITSDDVHSRYRPWPVHITPSSYCTPL